MYWILSFMKSKPIPDSLFLFFSASLMSNPFPLSSMVMLRMLLLCESCTMIWVESAYLMALLMASCVKR